MSDVFLFDQVLAGMKSATAEYSTTSVKLKKKWLKKNVEPANFLEPGQGGGRQGRCVGINMKRVHFIQQEARRQGKRVHRVDIDLKNAFNAMSQAALWRVMRMLTYIHTYICIYIHEYSTHRAQIQQCNIAYSSYVYHISLSVSVSVSLFTHISLSLSPCLHTHLCFQH
jgi:hypothetical protein